MNIVDHKRISKNKNRPKRFGRLTRVMSLICAVTVLIYGSIFTVKYLAPAPELMPTSKKITHKPETIQIDWPKYGQSAVGELEAGVLATSQNQSPRPIASVTKAMTALAILRQKPLSIGEQGPTITLDSTDVAFYDDYISKDGSVVQITSGEQISQYQGLQAMMLPSANNMADSMARWAFGSVKEYTQFASTMATSLGMKNTTISDASGFSPQTVSTAHDVVLLGQAVLKDPVLAQIVALSNAKIPVEGDISNVNYLLGKEGINGIKTGNTDEAGGCFLVSAERTLTNGQKKTLIAAVLGAPARNMAMSDSIPLLDSTQNNFAPVKVASAGQVAGYYGVPWGDQVQAEIKQYVEVFEWRGTETKLQITLEPIRSPVKAGTKIGIVKAVGGQSQSDIILKSDINSPNSSWRIQRAYQW